MVGDVSCQPWWYDFATENTVFIGLRLGGMASVKFRQHFFHAQNPDTRGQPVIQNFTKINERNGAPGRKSGCLGARVHARVSPTGALRKDLFARDTSNCFGENSLHRWQARLNLPSMEFRAVVRNRQFEIPGHVEFFMPRTS